MCGGDQKGFSITEIHSIATTLSWGGRGVGAAPVTGGEGSHGLRLSSNWQLGSRKREEGWTSCCGPGFQEGNQCHMGERRWKSGEGRPGLTSRHWNLKAKSTCLRPAGGEGKGGMEEEEEDEEGVCPGMGLSSGKRGSIPSGNVFRTGQGRCWPQGQERCWAWACWPPPARRR